MTSRYRLSAVAMKLIIQIPCLNEEETLPVTLADLPREVHGFESVEWLIIDDGSTDRTIEVARENGVDHIVRLTNNKGLASGFQAGLDAALKLGADVIVNTDADNQYYGPDVARLVAPIVAGEADMVVGDREVQTIEHFSAPKKLLQRLGSWVVRQASQTTIPDTTSGFRAYNREAALAMQVVSKFTYTLETIIQAGKMTVAVDHVPVRTNPKLRESRLFPSMWTYIRRNGVSIFRIYAMYEPLRVFMTAALLARRRRARRLGPLPLLLPAGRRRRPRAVADPRRGAVQRRDGAGRARRARRPAVGPADHAAADLRAHPARRARARRAAFALRAGRARDRAGADHRRPRGRPRHDRRATGREAVSTAITRDAEGTVTGNTYDKYGSTNPVVRRLMAGFERTLDELFRRAAPRSLLDVGCGEGVLTHRWAQRIDGRVVGIDLEDPAIQAEWEKRQAPNLEYRVMKAENLPFADGEFDVATRDRGARARARPRAHRGGDGARGERPPARVGPARAAVAGAQRRPRRVRARPREHPRPREPLVEALRSSSCSRGMARSWRRALRSRGPCCCRNVAVAVHAELAERGAEAKGRSGYGRGARILSVGIATTGVVTFAYFALASHSLSEVDYKGISVLWSVLFLIISIIYRPVEQLLSHTIASRRAQGHEAHPLRVPLTIQLTAATLFLAVALAFREPIEEDVFDGSAELYWVLVVAVLAYAASYFARGWLAGHQRFGLYGGLVLLESVSRCLFALAVAVGIADGQGAVALGIAAAPLVSLMVVPWAIERRGRARHARGARRRCARARGSPAPCSRS